MKTYFYCKGFTLVEVLITIGIIGIIVGLSIPFYQNYQISSQLDINSSQIVQTLRKAQSQAMASQNYQTFGVYFESRKFVLFKGGSYNPSDPDNEIYELPSSITLITLQFPTQVIFSRVKGIPSAPLTITIRSNNNQSRTININEIGKVDLI